VAKELPDLLTVEEAARLLRVGRTKAYAMAREWRATSGRSGLPVVDIGHILRVPRHALEELVGGELRGSVDGELRAERADGPAPLTPVEPAAGTTPTKPKRRAKRSVPPGQTTLPLTG